MIISKEKMKIMKLFAKERQEEFTDFCTKNLFIGNEVAACIFPSATFLQSVIESSRAREFDKRVYPKFKKIHSRLVKKKYKENNPFLFNGDEDTFFYIPNKEKKILCYTSKNSSFIMIDEKNYFSIREIYPELKDEDDISYLKDIIKNVEGNPEFICKNAYPFIRFTDYYNKNKYCYRPSLQYFKDIQFNLTYHDKRDVAHIATYDRLFNKYIATSKCDYDIEYFSVLFDNLLEGDYGNF